MNMTRWFPPVLMGALLLSVSAQASTIFQATLTGAQEVAPTGSPATGFITVTLNGDSLTVNLSFLGLTGGSATAAHIHCCVPVGTNVGVAVGFIGFPASTSGTYSHTFNLLDSSVYTPAFVTNFGGGTTAGAEAALIAGLNGNMAYANIHDATFPGGEIRGNLNAVPEPSTALLLMGGMLGVVGLAWRRNRRVSA